MFRYTLLMLSVLGLVGVVLSLFRFDWATTAGLDFWNAPSLNRDEETGQCLSDQLDARSEIILNRIAAKQEVVHDLMEHRLTLIEAAARFRRFNRQPPEDPAGGPLYYPGRTENERYCRQVLSWVDCLECVGCAPSQIEELKCRLEEELDAHLASHGGEVVLPDF